MELLYVPGPLSGDLLFLIIYTREVVHFSFAGRCSSGFLLLSTFEEDMILTKIKSGNGKIRVITLLVFLILLPLPVYSQNHITIILQNIPQKKVREYILIRSFDQLNDFSSIHASWNKNTDKYDFNVITETFYVKNRLPVVWDYYRHTSPLKMWNGRSYRFGLLLCKGPESVIYANGSCIPDIDTGQIYFLNLRLIKGLLNVPVAFEIINIDEEKRIMELSYINNNKSLGKQIIEFSDDGDGQTRIIHTSYFKSDSRLRDGLFYPYFHTKFIEEFHRNMRKLINNVTSS